MYQLVPKKKNWFVKILIFLVVLFITRQVIVFILAPAPVSQQLNEFAQSVNKRCPFVVDSVITLRNCEAMRGDRIHFTYELNTTLKKENIDTASLQATYRKTVINKISTDPALAYIKDNEISYSATFYNKEGIFLYNVAVSPKEIKGK